MVEVEWLYKESKKRGGRVGKVSLDKLLTCYKCWLLLLLLPHTRGKLH